MSAAVMTKASGVAAAPEAERDLGAERVSPDLVVRETLLEANVTALAASPGGCVAGLGDGRVIEFGPDGVVERARHAGAVTQVHAQRDGAGFSSGQDGAVLSFPCGATAAPGGTPTVLHQSGGDWITASAAHAERGLLAAAVGRSVMLFRGGALVGRLSDHPSSATGLAFSPTGDRLAVSRYDGVTLWPTDSADAPETLYWKGSAVGVSWSPDGRFVAAATQDRELHVWDLATGRDYRLGGFQAKARQIDWTADGAFLVSSGADVIAAWPIAGEPGAFPPSEIGYAYSAHVTAVAAGGAPDRLAGGFSNGAVLIGDARSGVALVARAGAGQPVSQVAWDHASGTLYYGGRDGALGMARRQTG